MPFVAGHLFDLQYWPNAGRRGQSPTRQQFHTSFQPVSSIWWGDLLKLSHPYNLCSNTTG